MHTAEGAAMHLLEKIRSEIRANTLCDEAEAMQRLRARRGE